MSPSSLSKLADADGQQQETQHWLGTAHECQYITKDSQTNLIARYEQVGKMLQSMIDKADSFCGPNLTDCLLLITDTIDY
jgi:four helix bundle protein